MPIVAVSAGCEAYGERPPYSPSTRYPEYPFDSDPLSESPNPAYEGVRNAFRLLCMDREHDDSRLWNPLGIIVRPGNTVVLKPNFVRDFRETQPGHGDCLIAH